MEDAEIVPRLPSVRYASRFMVALVLWFKRTGRSGLKLSGF